MDSEIKRREVRVLREIKIDMEDIKKGDIFRSLPADETDVQANPESWWMASKDAEKVSPEKGYAVVNCEPMSFVTGKFFQAKEVAMANSKSEPCK